MIIKRKLIIIVILSFLIITFGFLKYYFHLRRIQPEQPEKIEEISHNPCLADDEIADFDYNLAQYESTGVKLPDNATTTIFVKNKNTNEELFRFTINNVPVHSPSIEIHKCGVYVIRNFDLDEEKGFYKRKELWYYQYDGSKRMLIGNESRKNHLYSFSGFRVDPSESFLALDRAYLGHSDHAVVIKKLKTSQLEDILTIKPDDIWQRYPQLNKERNIGVVGWSSDGKYFWGASQSQTDTTYFRININDKNKESLEVFVMPDDAVHHGPPRLDTGYIWYIYGPPWLGFYELQQEAYKEWKKAGNKKTLFLYNLFTKEKIKLVEVDDPSWNFMPRWLSDTELRYRILPGEIKIYKIKF